MKRFIKKLIIVTLPLALRKRLAIRVNRCTLLDANHRAYWSTELLVDMASTDPNEYHRFLWSHHLAYASSYEANLRFGYGNFNESRKQFFGDLKDELRKAGIDGARDVESVLEVGCSLGYLLRYMETDVFPSAARIVGVDVDTRAIEDGRRHLANAGSRVHLLNCDLESLDATVDDGAFDFVLASGVLLYFDQPSAAAIVKTLINRTRRMLAITALAHPDVDNKDLLVSEIRESDGTWIHNVDQMLTDAGARVTGRRWEGERIVDGNTIYFLYAVPRDGSMTQTQ